MEAKKLLFIIGLLGILSASAFATEGELEQARRLENSAAFFTRGTEPETVYLRTEAVFKHLEIPDEPDYAEILKPLQGKVSASELSAMIRTLDFKSGESGRFWRLEGGPSGPMDWVVYRDRDSKRHEDFRVRLASESTPTPAAPKPRIQGMRIALDPGHMGAREWDALTGKYVQDSQGNRLSEGLLVLQLAHLLRDRLEQAGAMVTLTRELPGPASFTEFGKFDSRYWIQEEIRESAHQNWFLNLVEQFDPGPDLWSALTRSPKYQTILNYSRAHYFIDGPDLQDRAVKIQDAQPDLAVILHLDTNCPPSNPNGLGSPKSGVKAYVPGAFLPGEYATRERRAYFAANALNPEIWKESVRLSRSIVGEIHTRLGIAFDSSDPTNTKVIAPGVFARSLNVQRHIPGTISTYLEGLYYSDPTEFRKLTDYRYSIQIGGKTYPYSERLVELADAIEAGVTRYLE